MAIFDEELMALKERVLKIGSMVEAGIHDSVMSLVITCHKDQLCLKVS